MSFDRFDTLAGLLSVFKAGRLVPQLMGWQASNVNARDHLF